MVILILVGHTHTHTDSCYFMSKIVVLIDVLLKQVFSFIEFTSFQILDLIL